MTRFSVIQRGGAEAQYVVTGPIEIQVTASGVVIFGPAGRAHDDTPGGGVLSYRHGPIWPAGRAHDDTPGRHGPIWIDVPRGSRITFGD